jgi:hypothetical protein
MTRKRVGRNAGNSGRVNLSGPELEQFGAEIGSPIKIDIAESKAIALAMIEHSADQKFIIVSKPDAETEAGTQTGTEMEADG